MSTAALTRYRLWQAEVKACAEPHVREELLHRRPLTETVARVLHVLCTHDDATVVTDTATADAVIAVAQGEVTHGTRGSAVVHVLPQKYNCVTCVHTPPK